MHQAERGLFDLRRGRIACVTGPEAATLVATVESLDRSNLDELRGLAAGRARLVVTRHRAAAMGLGPEGTGGAAPARSNGRPHPLSLGLPDEIAPAEIFRRATGASKQGAPDADLREATATESGGLRLVRLGRLLPAVLAAPADLHGSPRLRESLDRGAILRVPLEEIEALAEGASETVRRVSEARVPLDRAEDARFILFREGNGLYEHVAVVIGEPDSGPEAVPVRLHSACVTGDLFGSLRCDCGEQLRASMGRFIRKGGGVLLYLAHEGRSIGLANKLRAYAMQEEGLDTIDADCALGFGADERSYAVAVEILRQLGVGRVRLLTNNPEKVRAMERGGIRVEDREPLHGTLNAHNLPYVSAKARRAGHWMEGMLSRRVPGV